MHLEQGVSIYVHTRECANQNVNPFDKDTMADEIQDIRYQFLAKQQYPLKIYGNEEKGIK